MTISPETYNLRHRKKLGALFSDLPTDDHDDHHLTYSPRRHSDAAFFNITTDHGDSGDASYSNPSSGCSSPNLISSPWTHPSPYTKSPWIHQIVPSSVADTDEEEDDGNPHDKIGLLGSLFREQGHVYSIASAGGLLYTGSDSKNVRVWKDLDEFSGFKSSSGLVKAIVVFGDRVFTGHQDGKIRVWKYLGEKRAAHKRVGNLPTTRDLIFKSINPRNYTKARRRRRVPWVKHYDAVSCLCVDPGLGLLYSGSWDKTLKVWRISDSKCVESIRAHDDAVNAVVVGFDGLVFTASADGAVKAWRRRESSTRHVLVETLLRQGSALTSLAVSGGGLYAGSSDGFVSFWEREKQRDFMSYGGVLRGHKLAVLCVAAGGDRLVMSGWADESVCVWRRDGGGGHTCLAVLTGHTGPVKCLAVEKDVSGDDQWIVYSGSLDKSVKLWRVSERVGRELEGHIER